MKHILSLILFISVFNLQASQPSFLLGVDVFMQGYVDRFCAGKTVGLMTNQSGLNAEGKTTIDLLYQHPSAKLVKLFAPEHGIRGKIEAGIHFKDSKDSITGLPIVSLYGVHGYRPKVDSLRGLDMVIYDIQDVGSRAYTYIWSLREMMTVCGQLGIDVIVLDRPDPYGAAVLDGPICDTSINSLLTRSAIPRVYGMTVGEIARYFNKEDRLGCNLIVIPMAGYKRGMLFENTGIKWKETSPNIPDLGAARCFPMTGTLGLLGQLHIGIRKIWFTRCSLWCNLFHASKRTL